MFCLRANVRIMSLALYFLSLALKLASFKGLKPLFDSSLQLILGATLGKKS